MQYAAAPQMQYAAAPQVQYAAAPQMQYSQQAVYAAAPAQRIEEVQLPADAFPGKEYELQTQTGQMVTFQVPPGMGPGSVVSVEY